MEVSKTENTITFFKNVLTTWSESVLNKVLEQSLFVSHSLKHFFFEKKKRK